MTSFCKYKSFIITPYYFAAFIFSSSDILFIKLIIYKLLSFLTTRLRRIKDVSLNYILYFETWLIFWRKQYAALMKLFKGKYIIENNILRKVEDTGYYVSYYNGGWKHLYISLGEKDEVIIKHNFGITTEYCGPISVWVKWIIYIYIYYK